MEIWKKLKNYEGLYEVSSLGRIRNKKKYVLSPFIGPTGYLCLYIYKNGVRKKVKIHQLIAIVFLNHIPCGMKLVINHIDGNKLNNNDYNLEITTQKENSKHWHRLKKIIANQQLN